MKVVTVARFSNVVGAIVWVVGVPYAGMSGVLFPSDAEYFWFGAVFALLGLSMFPLALIYAGVPPGRFSSVVRRLGVLACAAVFLSAALLVAGSMGWLGETAPNWILSASGLSVTGLFLWVLVASFSTLSSRTLGRAVFRLGFIAGASYLAVTLFSVLQSYLYPGFMVTNATMPLVFISFGLTWFGLPAWLVALAVRMRSGTVETADAAGKIDAPAQPPITTG